MKTPLKNILFPTDFSDLSKNALITAIAMCKRHQANLHLFHAVEVQFTTAPPESLTIPVYILPDLEKAASDRLAGLVKEINASDPSIVVKTHLMTGNPAHSITEKAIELNCDLIVMGTHGTSGIREFFIGSNAYAVIKNTTIPVLTIPGTTEVAAFKKILFPVRATQGVMEKYDFIDRIIEKNKATLAITALALPDEVIHRNGLDDDIGKLAVTLKASGTAFKASFYVCTNYAKKVLELSQKTKADLIVINATLDYEWKDFFIGPYAQQVVNHSKIPVLSMRTPAKPSSLAREHIMPANKATLAF